MSSINLKTTPSGSKWLGLADENVAWLDRDETFGLPLVSLSLNETRGPKKSERSADREITASPGRSRPRYVEAEHHPALGMLGDVAVRHPQTWIRDVKQDVHGPSHGHEHGFLPYQVGLRLTITRQDEGAAGAMDVEGVVHRVIRLHLVDESDLHLVTHIERPGDRLKGTQTNDPHLDSAFVLWASFSREVRFVLLAFVYLLLRHLFRLMAGSSNEQLSTEVELVVLRHQLMVLKRQVGKAASSPSRPAIHGCDQQSPSASSVVIFPRHPADAPSVAPGAREAEVDLPAEVRRRQAIDSR